MEIRLPIIHFPVRTVSFREGIMYMYVCPTKNVPWNSPNMPAELEKNLWWFYQWPDHVILSMFGTCRKGQWSTGRERNFQQKVAVPCSQWCKCCWFNWPPVTELGWLEDDSPLLGIYCMIYMFSFKCIVYILSHKCHVFIQLIYLIQQLLCWMNCLSTRKRCMFKLNTGLTMVTQKQIKNCKWGWCLRADFF